MRLPGFSTSAPPVPSFQPLPTENTQEVKDAAERKRKEELQRRKGAPKTILTSGLGDTTQAPAEQPKLRETLG